MSESLPGRWMKGAGVGLVLLLAGCGDEAISPAKNSVDNLQAQVLGGAVYAQIEDVVSGLTSFDYNNGGFGGFLAPKGPAAQLARLLSQSRLVGPRGRLSILKRSGVCNPEQSNPLDSDNDGVPNDNTLTFSPGNCSETDPQSGATTVLSGKVRIQDQGTMYGYILTFSSLRMRIIPQGQLPVSTIGWDGSYAVLVNTSNAAATQDLEYTVVIGSNPAASVSYNWDVTFTPDPGKRIVLASPWPTGTFDVSGSMDYAVSDGNSYEFNIDTPTPVRYDAACGGVQPAGGGEIIGLIATNQNAGFSVAYGGCDGAPTMRMINNTVSQ